MRPEDEGLKVTIKETAGKMLLYFYQLQRTVPLTMPYRQVGFIDKKDGGVSLTSDKKWLTGNLLDINQSATDIFNAFIFLVGKDYIKSHERVAKGAKIYVGIQLTGQGVDIVEGIERGSDGKHDFAVNFNIHADDGMDVEALIAEHLSMLSSDS